MNHASMTVRYAISGDAARLRGGMEGAAAAIADAPGLVFKLWRFDAGERVGVSAYFFASEAAAAAFASGPIIAGLKAHPDVGEVSFAIAPVDEELSAVTGGAAVLAKPALKAAV